MIFLEKDSLGAKSIEEDNIELGNPNDLISELVNSETGQKAALTLGGEEKVREYILNYGMEEFMNKFNSDTTESDEAYFNNTELEILDSESPIHQEHEDL